MDIQILDLDGSVPLQQTLVSRFRAQVLDARTWGPRVRLGCGFEEFRRFEQALATLLGRAANGPTIICYGSGDFHHVSLALLRRLTEPFNLLVFDNHPDWMRRVPLIHCGSWLYHAAQLPTVQRVFHVGGDVDFDNYYRWLAPWQLLRDGRITIFPARRRFQRGPWRQLTHEPLRPGPLTRLTAERIEQLLRTYQAELARWPLYISVDKDVLTEWEAVVNWDSGHLDLKEVRLVLDAFLRAAQGRLVGMDLLGDWSPVQLRGPLRYFLHLTEHPRLEIEAGDATQRNEWTNLALLETVRAHLAQPSPDTQPQSPLGETPAKTVPPEPREHSA